MYVCMYVLSLLVCQSVILYAQILDKKTNAWQMKYEFTLGNIIWDTTADLPAFLFTLYSAICDLLFWLNCDLKVSCFNKYNIWYNIHMHLDI